MVLISRSDLIDNITNTDLGKPNCAIMQFTLNVKILGTFVSDFWWSHVQLSENVT